ncbi:MAG: GNAT family N-acetyltransferase [Verrucomicrobia bacterium]|nr:GNAT family N-acetyltransferase [Verrucomicrobiota bacterium]
MRLSILSKGNAEKAARLATYSFSSLLGLDDSQIQSRWLEDIVDVLDQPVSGGVLLEECEVTLGIVAWTLLPWESKILGRQMSTLRVLSVDHQYPDRDVYFDHLLKAALDSSTQNGNEFLLCKMSDLDDDKASALRKNGFEEMDTLVDFVCALSEGRSCGLQQKSVHGGFELRLATVADLDSLAEIARASFANHFGRFHTDPRIGREQATHIYEEWIRSCALGWADWVIVAVKETRVAGYAAWKKPSSLDLRHNIRLAHYSIAGIHPDFFGKGLFTTLTRTGMEMMQEHAQWLEGPTHIDNHPVQRAYEKLGWKRVGTQTSFHKWLTP